MGDEEREAKKEGDGENATSEKVRMISIDPSESDHLHHNDNDDDVVVDQPTLPTLVKTILSQVFYPDGHDASAKESVIRRLRSALADHGPSVKDASRNTINRLLQWTRRGSPFRALFLISVGTVMSLALTGLLVFMFFFFAATANAIVISLLISLAAAGGFLAIFFACVTGIYIAALSVALFVISTATISTIIAALVATGWLGFLWVLWLAAKKSIDLTKHSLSMTGSAISAYSAARRARHYGGDKSSG